MNTFPIFVSAIIVFHLAGWCSQSGSPSPIRFDLELVGTTDIRYQQPRGFKGSEAGILRLGMEYSFTDQLSSTCRLRATRSSSIPVLEHATISYHQDGYAITTGFIYERIGLAQLYKPRQLSNRYSEHPVLWESTGFGFSGIIDHGTRYLSLSATMNNKETGSVYTVAGLKSDNISGVIVAGAQANDDWYQEIALKAGTDLQASYSIFRIHIVSALFYYPEYAFTDYLLVVPGYRAQLFGEGAADLFGNFEMSCMGIYRRYAMNTLHTEKEAGIQLQYNFPHRLFSGIGLEGFRRDKVDTGLAELFFGISLPEKRGSLRVGINRVTTALSGRYWKLTGNLWFVY
jgi:hypothetical protein